MNFQTTLTTVLAVAASATAEARDPAQDERDLLKVEAAICRAFEAGDADTLRKSLDKQFTLTDSKGTVTNLDQNLAEVSKRDPVYEVFKNHHQKVVLYGDAAVVTASPPSRVTPARCSSRATTNSQTPGSTARASGSWPRATPPGWRSRGPPHGDPSGPVLPRGVGDAQLHARGGALPRVAAHADRRHQEAGGRAGGPLLLRDRGGAKLTPLGRLVLPRLQRIDDESRSVALIAENHRRLKQVPLRVGVLCTIGPARLSGYLAAFRAVAPGVEVELQRRHAGTRCCDSWRKRRSTSSSPTPPRPCPTGASSRRSTTSATSSSFPPATAWPRRTPCGWRSCPTSPTSTGSPARCASRSRRCAPRARWRCTRATAPSARSGCRASSPRASASPSCPSTRCWPGTATAARPLVEPALRRTVVPAALGGPHRLRRRELFWQHPAGERGPEPRARAPGAAQRFTASTSTCSMTGGFASSSGALRHQRRGDLAAQVRLTARIVGERVDDAERRWATGGWHTSAGWPARRGRWAVRPPGTSARRLPCRASPPG